jgi:hypothetical protein
MAKELTPKTRVIREAILANPEMGPKALARLINEAAEREGDKVHVTPGDVAAQQQAVRKAGASMPPARTTAPAPAPRAAPESPVEESEPPSEEKPPPRPARPRAAAKRAAAPEAAPPPVEAPPAKPAAPRAKRPGPIELIDRALSLAEDCGGLGELSRLVEKLLQLRGR